MLGLAGCSENEEQNISDNNLNEQHRVTSTEELSDITHGENLGGVSQLARRWNGDDVNQIALINVITDEIILSYEFDEYEYIEHVWTLNNGYHVAWVGEENFRNREFRIWQAQEEFGADFSSTTQDDRTEAERNMRMVIFNESLLYIESLPFTQGHIRLSNSALTMIDNELLIYGIRNMYSPTAPTWDVMRHNIHTGEVVVLFEHDREPTLTTVEFVDDHRIFIWYTIGAGTPQVRTFYGLLDVETGQIDSFEQSGFLNGGIYFTDSKVILTEPTAFGEFDLRNEIVVFDIETLEQQLLQLGHGETLLARPSLDGNHIVTISRRESVFRKYDINSMLFEEISIDLPDDFEYWLSFWFGGVIPMTSDTYLVRLVAGSFDEMVFHDQIVTLP